MDIIVTQEPRRDVWLTYTHAKKDYLGNGFTNPYFQYCCIVCKLYFNIVDDGSFQTKTIIIFLHLGVLDKILLKLLLDLLDQVNI